MKWLLLLLLTGCAAQPYIKVADQPADLVVEIDTVLMPEDGWIVIKNDNCGMPGEVIGLQRLSRGSVHGLSILISQNVTDKVHVSLHRDTGELGKYEYPVADPEFFAAEFSVTGKGEPEAIFLRDHIELRCCD
jgi:hypothetical protein